MKKIIYLVIITFVIFAFANNNSNVSAKTLGDLKKELAEMEANYKNQQQQQQLTQQEINNVYASIASITTQINNVEAERNKISDEIITLTKSIADKEEEIKRIINFLQVSSGESAYLEYAFGAQDFTDFIYRVSVTEQLTTHNDKLIDDFNRMIEENNQKKIDLNKKEIELKNSQVELNSKLKSLGNQLDSVMDLKMSVEGEMKLQREVIEMYENQLGCKDNEDIDSCGLKGLPAGNSFYRPIINGYVTSEFGNRCFMLKGNWTCDFHNGMDLGSRESAPDVYAAAPGRVSGVSYREPCGGNQIFIQHYINGSTYTTQYAHLLSVNVKVGDIVSSNTVIAKMGGSPSTTWWDSCSTGQHLHFSIANGLFPVPENRGWWSLFVASQLKPRNYLNLPSGTYNAFTGRTKWY